LGAEAVIRGQVTVKNEPSIPRLLQQLLTTPQDTFTIPNQAQKEISNLALLENNKNKNNNCGGSSLHSEVSAVGSSSSEKHEVEVDPKSNNKSKKKEEVNLVETGMKSKHGNRDVDWVEGADNNNNNQNEDNYLIKLEKPPSQDVAPPITGDNCTDEKIKMDRERLAVLEKDIEGREVEKKTHQQWIEQAKQAILKVQKHINQTAGSISLIDRSIRNLQQEKITVLNKMRKDELSYSLEEAKQSLKKLQEQSRGTQQEKVDLAGEKVLVQERIDKINLSLQELQTPKL
jgi:hypothetical protein